jgi:hypothetical protein
MTIMRTRPGSLELHTCSDATFRNGYPAQNCGGIVSNNNVIEDSEGNGYDVSYTTDDTKHKHYCQINGREANEITEVYRVGAIKSSNKKIYEYIKYNTNYIIMRPSF